MQELHCTDFFFVAVVLFPMRLRRRWLIVEEEIVCACDVGGVLILSPGVVVLQLAPEPTVTLTVRTLEESYCDGFRFGNGSGSFVDLDVSEIS